MQKVHSQNLLSSLAPIPLDGLDNVKLLNRVDRKYVIPVSSLPGIIRLLRKNQYSILEIDGRRSFNYFTTYFDTTDYQFYRDHHNHLPRRVKVRTRSYQESNLHYFEIKSKNNARTKKYRKELEEPTLDLASILNKKINKIFPGEILNTLTPALFNSYTRITLVNKSKTERCTIDLNLSFQDPVNPGKNMDVHDIAIIEVKQSKASMLHGIVAALRKMQIPPTSISKYVLGLILIHPEIKYNSFKPLLLRLNKIKNQQLAMAS